MVSGQCSIDGLQCSHVVWSQEFAAYRYVEIGTYTVGTYFSECIKIYLRQIVAANHARVMRVAVQTKTFLLAPVRSAVLYPTLKMVAPPVTATVS